MQNRATKLIISIKDLKYEERLRITEVNRAKVLVCWGDMIEVYKFFNKVYHSMTTVG